MNGKNNASGVVPHRYGLWFVSLGAALVLIVLVWQALARPQNIPAPDIPAGERLQCVSYSPYGPDEAPWSFLDDNFSISAARLETDLALLAERFDCVRTYSSAGMEGVVPAAARHGLEVMLGIWVNDNKAATEKEIKAALGLVRQYHSAIRAVVVGNEVLLRKELTGRQLAAVIRRVKAEVGDVPVTYGEVSDFWHAHPELGPAVDFIFIHLLPYWINDPVAIADVRAYFVSEYDKIARRFPGKEVVIGESGWPGRGRMREGALPSPVNAAWYLRSFVAQARERGWRYNVF